MSDPPPPPPHDPADAPPFDRAAFVRGLHEGAAAVLRAGRRVEWTYGIPMQFDYNPRPCTPAGLLARARAFADEHGLPPPRTAHPPRRHEVTFAVPPARATGELVAEVLRVFWHQGEFTDVDVRLAPEAA